MADIGVRIVGEDQASSAFRAIAESSRATAQEVGNLGSSFSGMSNIIAGGVVKGQAIIGLFNGILGAAQNVTGAISGFINQTQAMNSDLESTRQSFSVLLGSAEKATVLLNQMRVASQTTTMSFEDFRNSAKYLLGFQFEASKVVDITKAIGAAVYALNAQNVGGMDRIIRALGQMKAAGRVTLQDLNQLTDVGVPAIKMLADAFGVSTEQITQMIHKGVLPAEQAINGLITQFQKLYGSNMAAMSGNLAVLTSNFSDYVQQAQQAIGSGIFETNKKRLQELTNIVSSPIFMKIANQLGTTLGNAYQKFNDVAVTPVIRSVAQFMNMLDTVNPRPAIMGLMTNLENIMSGLVNQYFGGTGLSVVKNFMSVLNQFASGVVKVLQGGNIFDVFNEISKIGQDTTAGRFIGNLSQEFSQLLYAGKQLKDGMIPIIKDLMDTLASASNDPSVRAFANAFTELFSVTDKDGRKFRLQFGEIMGFIRVSVTGIIEVLTPVADLLKGLFATITPALRVALDIMTQTVGLVNGVKGIFAEVQNKSVQPAREAGDAIAGNFASGLSSSLNGTVGTISESIVNKLGSLGGTLASSNAVAGAWQGVGANIADSISNGYQGGFAGLVNKISSAIGVPTIKINSVAGANIVGGYSTPNSNPTNDANSPLATFQGGNEKRIVPLMNPASDVGATKDPVTFQGGGVTRVTNNQITIVTRNTDSTDLKATANYLFVRSAFQ
jgi:tape measure domain-containing protein